jgi:hypothetical protein
MKTIMKNLFLSSIAVILVACTKDDKPQGLNKPYYQFTQDDKEKLLTNFELNKEFTYKNQKDERIKFKVLESSIAKDAKLVLGLSGSSPVFYFDKQNIELSSIGESFAFSYTLERYPVGYTLQIPNPIAGTPQFRGYLEFPFWNGSDSTIIIDYNSPVKSMVVNGINYSKIIEMKSSTSTSKYPKNVHLILYDINSGVIGYDDIDGNKWRLE